MNEIASAIFFGALMTSGAIIAHAVILESRSERESERRPRVLFDHRRDETFGEAIRRHAREEQ